MGGGVGAQCVLRTIRCDANVPNYVIRGVIYVKGALSVVRSPAGRLTWRGLLGFVLAVAAAT